jgi:hypothetical protein
MKGRKSHEIVSLTAAQPSGGTQPGQAGPFPHLRFSFCSLNFNLVLIIVPNLLVINFRMRLLGPVRLALRTGLIIHPNFV